MAITIPIEKHLILLHFERDIKHDRDSKSLHVVGQLYCLYRIESLPQNLVGSNLFQ